MSGHENINYYRILDVPTNSSQNEIVAAYYKAKSTFSEDSVAIYSLYTPQEIRLMREKIDEAFNVLNSREKRQAYDHYMRQQQQARNEAMIEEASRTAAFSDDLEAEELPNFEPVAYREQSINSGSDSGLLMYENLQEDLVLPGAPSKNGRSDGRYGERVEVQTAPATAKNTSVTRGVDNWVGDRSEGTEQDSTKVDARVARSATRVANKSSHLSAVSPVADGANTDGTVKKAIEPLKPKIRIGVFAEPADRSRFTTHEVSKASVIANAKAQEQQNQNSISSFDQNWQRDVSLAKSKEYFQNNDYQVDAEKERQIKEERNFTGAFLRSIREYKNISVEQLAFKTKISVKNIEGIEADDYASLPSRVFLRGFLQQYCKVLGLSLDGINTYLAKARS